MMNFFDLRIYCKSLIARNPTTPETTTPTMYEGMSAVTIACSEAASLKLITAPARIVGTERMNVYCAANSLSSPEATPAVIVEPEREIPGIIATACIKPTASELPSVMFAAVLFLSGSLSQIRRIMPFTTSAAPTAHSEFFIISALSLNIKARNSGRHETMSMSIIRSSGSAFFSENFPRKTFPSIEKKPLNSPTISLRNAMQTATRVPT